jgi:hypothetical protein
MHLSRCHPCNPDVFSKNQSLVCQWSQVNCMRGFHSPSLSCDQAQGVKVWHQRVMPAVGWPRVALRTCLYLCGSHIHDLWLNPATGWVVAPPGRARLHSTELHAPSNVCVGASKPSAGPARVGTQWATPGLHMFNSSCTVYTAHVQLEIDTVRIPNCISYKSLMLLSTNQEGCITQSGGALFTV